MLVTDAGKYLRKLWRDACTIQTAQKTTQENGATRLSWVDLCRDEPCKVSFHNHVVSAPADTAYSAASAVQQETKVFIRPDLDVPAGSRITVSTHGGKTLYFESSSIPLHFTNHQEILVEVVQKWA